MSASSRGGNTVASLLKGYSRVCSQCSARTTTPRARTPVSLPASTAMFTRGYALSRPRGRAGFDENGNPPQGRRRKRNMTKEEILSQEELEKLEEDAEYRDATAGDIPDGMEIPEGLAELIKQQGLATPGSNTEGLDALKKLIQKQASATDAPEGVKDLVEKYGVDGLLARLQLVRQENPDKFVDEDAQDPPLPKQLTWPVHEKATHTLKAGMILTRAPILTRTLTSFEESFFFYQKRLNERLTLPFMEMAWFRPDTPEYYDWRLKVRRRKMVASKEIGHYIKRGREAWNDEELVGSKMASQDTLYETLLKDSEMLINEEGEQIKPEDVVPVERPRPRRSEADEKNDRKRLDRKMDRTLYLVVQRRNGEWQFPAIPIAMEEALHQTARRALKETCGVNMNTWVVGRIPVAHIVSPPIYKEPGAPSTLPPASTPTPAAATSPSTSTSTTAATPETTPPKHIKKLKSAPPTATSILEHRGNKTWFLKGRIMAGQADLSGNMMGLKDFLWLTKEELQEVLDREYYHKCRNMMADR